MVAGMAENPGKKLLNLVRLAAFAFLLLGIGFSVSSCEGGADYKAKTPDIVLR